MKKVLFITMLLGALYSTECEEWNAEYGTNFNCNCNESTWQEHYNSDGHNMQGCWLPGANLSYADLSYADLSYADLSYADLTGAVLYQVNLSYANLTGANLYYAILQEACLENAYSFTQTEYFGLPILEGCAEASNNPPIAQDGSYTLDEDAATTTTLEASDQDGDALSYVITESPNNGTLTLSGNIATYIPNINFNGTDFFQFQAYDGQTYSNQATVVFVINAVNDAPYLFPIDNVSIEVGESFSYTLQAEDVDGDNLIYTATLSGGNATINIEGNILTIVPEESNVTLNVVVTASDSNATHSTSFIITVLEQQTTCLDNNNDGLCDHFPTISIIDGNATILMQNTTDTYIDSGASCSDQEDGDISHQVEVSGDVVNMSNPGTYIISYNCSDSDGNTAQTQKRTVFIVPPTIADLNEDGFDDDAFMAGAQSGDANLDGILNVIDIVIYINSILNGE